MLFQQACQEFLEEQEYKGNSPKTLEFYSKNFTVFEKGTHILEIAEFTEARVRSWLASRKAVSRNTLAHYDRALRVFANWLHRRGYVAVHPKRQLPKPRLQPTKIVPFSARNVKAMLDVAKGRPNPLRDMALIILLLDTGVRIGEACNLRLKDVQWPEFTLQVNGKTGERDVPVGRRALRSLRRYVDSERTAAGSRIRGVFLDMNGYPLKSTVATRHLVRIARSANVKTPKVGPHNFRHTFAVEFIRNGGDAFTLQQILGHTTLDMTRKYVHLAKTDLRAAHRRFAPGDRMLRGL